MERFRSEATFRNIVKVEIVVILLEFCLFLKSFNSEFSKFRKLLTCADLEDMTMHESILCTLVVMTLIQGKH